MKGFVIFRDRLRYGKRCVAAMMVAGLEPVVVDMGSSWPPAVAWLDHLDKSGVMVLRKGGGHPRGLWDWQPFTAAHAGDRYVVSDPDTVPSEMCPHNWVKHLGRMLDAHPVAVKAGLGLRIDNLPDHYARKRQVIEWETRWWEYPLGDGSYRAGVDTTMALYPEEASEFRLDGALRTGPPYTADHLAWHENFSRLPAEIRYYYDHAEPGIAHWAARGQSAWGD
jgi:hypothetical protein